MKDLPADELTQLLRRWNDGDETALEELTPLVYRELHRLACHYMGNERLNHPLQPTALVSEACLRLTDWNDVRWNNRGHFLAVLAQSMRRILVDHARSRRLTKSGAVLAGEDKLTNLVEIDIALQRLAAIDPTQTQVVELRYFAGLSVQETAGVLGLAPEVIERHWNFAKAWLLRELKEGTQDAA